MTHPPSACRAVSLARLLAALSVALLAGGCAIHGTVDPYPPRHAHGAPVAIPEGHLPPPGQCRIWYPERPAGQQPPPGDCRELQHRVPPGAYLIRG